MKNILITSSALILILAALRYVLRGRIGLRLQYALWLLVALRLLVPVHLGQSAISALALLDRVEGTAAAQALEDVGRVSIPSQSFENTYAQVRDEYRARGVDVSALTGSNLEALDDEVQARMQGPTVAALAAEGAKKVWVAGVAVMAAWFLVVNLTFRRRARRGARPVEVGECPLPVYVSQHLASPCLLGLVRPAIYLTPECRDDPARRRYVLAHELTHWAHRDPWWAILRALCLCLYWFNPLVWWAASLSRRDCELACDEGALVRLGEGERLAYGRTLVNMVAIGASPARLLQSATTMADKKKGIRERVTLIAKKPKMMAVTVVCLVLVLAVAVSCTFTGTEQDLQQTLNTLPEELAGQVTLTPVSELEEGVLLDAYYAPDYDGAGFGHLMTVHQMTPGGFETTLLASDGSGWNSIGRGGDGYYTYYVPTDVPYSLEHQADYQQVAKVLLEWVQGQVLAQRGVEPYGAEELNAIHSAPFTYEGAHVNLSYYPYLAIDGTKDVVWTLVLAQPVTQGEGGLWCVERWRDAGDFPNTYLVYPETELSAVDYYAELQKQVGASEADWALDPMEVGLRFVKETFGAGHAYATADSFALGAFYSSVPGSANGQAEALLEDLLHNDEGKVGMGLWSRDSHNTTAMTLPSDDASLGALMAELTASFDWVDLQSSTPMATDPWGDPNLEYFLYLHTPDNNDGLVFYAGGDLVSYQSPQGSVNYQVLSRDGTGVAAFVRDWFDKTYSDMPKTAAQQAQMVMDRIMSRASVAVTLTTADGVGGGRYTASPDYGNGRNRQIGFDSAFDWGFVEGEPTPLQSSDVLLVESEDGTTSLRSWSTGDLVCATMDGEAIWLQGIYYDQEDVFRANPFEFMRTWYDEVELSALQGDNVIPARGQSYLEIAQAWVDAETQPSLQATPGSNYAFAYVKATARILEDMPDDYFSNETADKERFAFTYDEVFVPENEGARNHGMAGNTTDYTGGDAPEGALVRQLMGRMYLADDGWRCEGVGTG